MKNLFPDSQIYYGVKAGSDFSALLGRGVFNLKRDAKRIRAYRNF